MNLKEFDWKTINFKAVLVGWMIYIVGSFLIAIILGIAGGIFQVTTHSLGKTAELAAMNQEAYFPALILNVALVCAAGYLVAHYARVDELEHGLALGVVLFLTALWFVIKSHDQAPGWYLLINTLLVVPSAMAGGYLKMITAQSSSGS